MRACWILNSCGLLPPCTSTKYGFVLGKEMHCRKGSTKCLEHSFSMAEHPAPAWADTVPHNTLPNHSTQNTNELAFWLQYCIYPHQSEGDEGLNMCDTNEHAKGSLCATFKHDVHLNGTQDYIKTKLNQQTVYHKKPVRPHHPNNPITAFFWQPLKAIWL